MTDRNAVPARIVLFDIASMKPGCRLLAALYGTCQDFPHLFDEWETQPTATMKRYVATDAQIAELVRKVKAKQVEAGT